MTELFDIGESLSPRMKWRRENIGSKILTHHEGDCDPPWLAILVQDEDKGKDIGLIMAESCRYYEELGFSAEADTEEEAIIELARKNNLRLWNEE